MKASQTALRICRFGGNWFHTFERRLIDNILLNSIPTDQTVYMQRGSSYFGVLILG